MENGAPFEPKFFNRRPLGNDLVMVDDSVVNCENGHEKNVNSASSFENFSDSVIENNLKETDEHFDSSFNNGSVKSEDCLNSSYDFTIDSSEFDPMRNLRMSIRRKRLSNSSVMSNNDSAVDEKRSFRSFKKRRKRELSFLNHIFLCLIGFFRSFKRFTNYNNTRSICDGN